MSWPGDERGSVFARFRTLPTAVQVTGVLTAGLVVVDLARLFKDILLPVVQLVTRGGGCP